LGLQPKEFNEMGMDDGDVGAAVDDEGDEALSSNDLCSSLDDVFFSSSSSRSPSEMVFQCFRWLGVLDLKSICAR
jgi:hypothetical protein